MTQELLLSTSISNDRKSAIKCCLFRAGHVFGNCAAVKLLSHNAGILGLNLQLVLLLKPEKGVCLQNTYSHLKTANWGLLHLCRDPLPGIKEHHPSAKHSKSRRKVSLDQAAATFLLEQRTLSRLRHRLLTHGSIFLKPLGTNTSFFHLAHCSTLILCSGLNNTLWTLLVQVFSTSEVINRTTGSGFKLKESRYKLDTRKKCITEVLE